MGPHDTILGLENLIESIKQPWWPQLILDFTYRDSALGWAGLSTQRIHDTWFGESGGAMLCGQVSCAQLEVFWNLPDHVSCVRVFGHICVWLKRRPVPS